VFRTRSARRYRRRRCWFQLYYHSYSHGYITLAISVPSAAMRVSNVMSAQGQDLRRAGRRDSRKLAAPRGTSCHRCLTEWHRITLPSQAIPPAGAGRPPRPECN
jgi:hypothetical protein